MNTTLIQGSVHVVLKELWKYLSPDDLLTFCSLNKEYYSLFQEKEIWIYLIKRDYNFEWNSESDPEKYYKSRHLLKRDYQINWNYDENPSEYYELRYLLNIPYSTPPGCVILEKCCYCSPNKYDLIAKKQHGICYICQRVGINKYDDKILDKLKESALKQPQNNVTYPSFTRGRSSFIINGYNIYDVITQVIANHIYPTLLEHEISLASHLCKELEKHIIDLKIKSWIDILEYFNTQSHLDSLNENILINKNFSCIVKRRSRKNNY